MKTCTVKIILPKLVYKPSPSLQSRELLKPVQTITAKIAFEIACNYFRKLHKVTKK